MVPSLAGGTHSLLQLTRNINLPLIIVKGDRMLLIPNAVFIRYVAHLDERGIGRCGKQKIPKALPSGAREPKDDHDLHPLRAGQDGER